MQSIKRGRYPTASMLSHTHHADLRNDDTRCDPLELYTCTNNRHGHVYLYKTNRSIDVPPRAGIYNLAKLLLDSKYHCLDSNIGEVLTWEPSFLRVQQTSYAKI